MSQHRSAWLTAALCMVATAASAQAVPALAPATSAARLTLEQLAQAATAAASARAAPLAAQLAPPPPSPAPATAPAAAAAAPELLEILGTPDSPLARIAIDGVVYTASAGRPELGASPCTLASIDVESRSAVVRCGGERQARTVRLGLGQRPGGQDRPRDR